MLESKKKANQKWNRLNYEQIKISVPKGTKEDWKAVAEEAGVSLAAYIKVSAKSPGV